MAYNLHVHEHLNPFKQESLAECLRGFLCLAVHFLLLFFFVRTFACQTMVVSSASMNNNLVVGDHVLVNMVYSRDGWNAIERFFMPPRALCRGMVVAFHPPGYADRVFVKRIIGLPGEEIRIQKGQVLVDGARLKETYLNDPSSSGRKRDSIHCHAPSGHYYCLGDNNAATCQPDASSISVMAV
ncbi:MAG TPA: signal peptidase I [Candidatus Aminicenantes bacterium]|nr:signal peptidase I [Candidatus Aminicenantes bacterium]